MSDGNQVARLALVGIGAYFGGPMGAQAGAMAGQMLFPGELPDITGPRLLDRRVTSSTLGSTINEVHGTFRINGNIIWSSGIDETAHERSVGKGGPTQTETSYTYTSTFAVALCKGEIQGIRKIWADGKLIFDVGENASATQVLVSKSAGYTIYNGTEDQIPDPSMQSNIGISLTNANREICYITFNQIQLEIYGNRIPSITAEVLSFAQSEFSFKALDMPPPNSNHWDNGAMDAMHYWDGITSYWVRAPYTDSTHKFNNITEYKTTPDGTVKLHNFELATDYQSIVQWPVYKGQSNNNKYLIEQYYYTELPTVRHRIFSLISFGEGPDYELSKISHDKTENGNLQQLGEWPLGVIYGVNWANFDDLLVVAGADNPSTNKPLIRYKLGNNPIGSFFDTGIDTVSDQIYTTTYNGTRCIRLSKSFLFILPQGGGSEILKYDKATFQLIDKWYSPTVHVTFDVANDDDILICQGANINIYENFSNSITKTITTPGLPTGTSISGSSQYKHNIHISNDLESYVFWYSYWHYNTTFAIGYKDLTSNTVTLASVITKLCESSGLQSSDIDVSSLTQEVTGYLIGSLMSSKASLESILAAYNIIAYESDWVIVFKTLDVESPEVISQSELGAGENSSSKDLISTKIGHTTELPRRVVVQYVDESRDYIVNTQKAQRIITNV